MSQFIFEISFKILEMAPIEKAKENMAAMRRSQSLNCLAAVAAESAAKKAKFSARSRSTKVWGVRRLLARKEEKGKQLYLVDWTPSESTIYPPSWEPAQNIAREMRTNFEEEMRVLERSRRGETALIWIEERPCRPCGPD